MMTDENDLGLPQQSDTPPDHVVLGIEIEIDLTPEWWEAILAVAPDHVRRMSTLEKPEQWYVRVELHKDNVEAFSADLAMAWEAFVEERKKQGRWIEPA